jgi:hypothetical protein
MMEPRRHLALNTGSTLRAPLFALVLAFALAAVAMPSAQAQTFSVIHSFTGGEDGYMPYAGVTVDQGGNLYGTTSEYNADLGGTVYQMKRTGGSWIFKTLANLYNYQGGFLPYGRPVIAPGGALYVTTFYGGNGRLRHGFQPSTAAESLPQRQLSLDRYLELFVQRSGW